MSSERFEGEQRALAFLQEMLSKAEFEQITERGYLEVPSPSKEKTIYRIPSGRGFIGVFERRENNGDEQMIQIERLCLRPVDDDIPDAEVVLIHKWLIETDEQGYLLQANHYGPSIDIGRRYRHDHRIHEHWGDNIL